MSDTKEKEYAWGKHYRNYVVDDAADVEKICSTASAIIHRELKTHPIRFEMIGTIFSVVYSVFISALKELRDDGKYDEVNINVGGRFAIGYSTKADSDDEKQGNFMVYMRHIGEQKRLTEYEEGSKTKERAVQWKDHNITKNPEIIKKVSTKAQQLLKDEYDITIGTEDLIMPIFCITYDALIEYLMIKRRELPPEDNFEVEINFISCFNITARDSGKTMDTIAIRPNIQAKLALKSDAQASGKYE